VFRRFLDLVKGEAALALCPSEATRADCVAAGIDEARLRVTPWGTAARPATAEDHARVRAEYGLARPFVLFAGTMEPRKNLPRLVAAFERLGPVDADLVLVGPDGWGGEQTGTGGAGTRRLGFVPTADLEALYGAAAVVAYPSLREGFGLPVLEAMAQSAAVVTSSTTSTAEVAGDAALLVDPLDTDAIAGALQHLLGDPDLAARLRVSARARAAEYTWARTADAVVAAYRDAAGTGA
jgi:glycosyltransferase involved in cell wall biosynthesis